MPQSLPLQNGDSSMSPLLGYWRKLNQVMNLKRCLAPGKHTSTNVDPLGPMAVQLAKRKADTSKLLVKGSAGARSPGSSPWSHKSISLSRERGKLILFFQSDALRSTHHHSRVVSTKSFGPECSQASGPGSSFANVKWRGQRSTEDAVSTTQTRELNRRTTLLNKWLWVTEKGEGPS